MSVDTPRRVLIVEDEAHIADGVRFNLELEGYAVEVVGDGRAAIECLVERDGPPFDLVILDLMLPEMNGYEVARRVRASGNYVAILMLTAKDDPADVVRGLEEGADDYLTKPFSIPELTARVRALLRRSRPTIASEMATFGDLALDRETRRVHRAGKEIHLGPTEFRLLDCLMQRPGRVYSRGQLLDIVWGRDVYVEVRTVDVHVGRLRKALNGRGQRDPIRTVRAAGYALDETYPS